MYSDGEVLRVNGWMFNPHREFTSVEAVVNGKLVATQTLQTRRDVARALPWIPHAAQSGFRIGLTQVRSGDRLGFLGDKAVVARLQQPHQASPLSYPWTLSARFGSADSREDRALGGIAPDGYYRGTFQTGAYSLGEWSRYFEIVEFVEGSLAHQDLVVMRRPREN